MSGFRGGGGHEVPQGGEREMARQLAQMIRGGGAEWQGREGGHGVWEGERGEDRGEDRGKVRDMARHTGCV